MASVEVIGLLCAGAVDFSRVAGRSGDGLTRAEIAGLLSGMDYVTMHFAMAKYACDESSLNITIRNMQHWVTTLALYEKWKDGSKSIVDKIAGVSVHESISPCVCPKCKGTALFGGVVRRYDFKSGKMTGVGIAPARKCTKCDGIGVTHLSGRQISEAIGIDESNYRRTWRARYDRCIDHLNEVDNSVRAVLRRSDK